MLPISKLSASSRLQFFNKLHPGSRFWMGHLLGRPLGYLIFSLMALIGDHIY